MGGGGDGGGVGPCRHALIAIRARYTPITMSVSTALASAPHSPGVGNALLLSDKPCFSKALNVVMNCDHMRLSYVLWGFPIKYRGAPSAEVGS